MHRRIDVAVRRVVLHVQDVIHTMRDHPVPSGETQRGGEKDTVLSNLLPRRCFRSENENIDPLEDRSRPFSLNVSLRYARCTCVLFENKYFYIGKCRG